MKIVSKDFCTFLGVYIAIYMGLCCKSYILLVPKFRTSKLLIKGAFWYFQIFSRVCYDWVLSIGYHVNFADLGVTLGLSTFCIIFPTFFRTSISPDFTWIFIDWVSAGFFPGVFSPWPEKKRHREKSPQKNVPPNSVKNIRPYSLSREDAIFATPKTPSENRMICINSWFWQIFPWVLLLGENFSDLILDFLFFYDDIFLWNFE